jgi:hypothetical protein
MKEVLCALAGALAVIACAPSAPITAPTPSSINAGYNQAWNAVIDVLAEDNVPVKTLDRSSGFVVAELSTMSLADLSHFTTNCGGIVDLVINSKSPYGLANYNILVRGDSTTSTVKVTARFVHGSTVCGTKNVFESAFQTGVKERAEVAHSSRSGFITPVSQQAPQPAPVSPESPQVRAASRASDPLAARKVAATKSDEVRAAPEPEPTGTSASASIGAPQSETDRVAARQAFVEAQAFVGNHQWAKAEESYQRAVLYDGSVAKYHAGMGTLMMTLHRWVDAEASYTAALLLDVDNAEYRARLKEARSRR